MANKVNNWEQLLEYANEELSEKGITIRVIEDDGMYDCEIDFAGVTEDFAMNCLEEELSDMVTDAWHHALEINEENVMGVIADNFGKLNSPQKVTMLTFLYRSMVGAEQEEFRKETEGA